MNSKIEQILSISRWAPSGDNQQTWRFKIIDESHFLVLSTDTRNTCWLDCKGRGSQLALGALLENIAIAASNEGCEAHFQYENNTEETEINVEVALTKKNFHSLESLYPFIQDRVTNRFPMKRQKLTASEKKALFESVQSNYELAIFDEEQEKQKMAALAAKGARVRLHLPSAYEDVSKIIDWKKTLSDNRLPAHSLGVPTPMLFMMKMALNSKKMFDFFNHYLGASYLSTFSLDYIPNKYCGGHFFLFSKQTLNNARAYVEAGRTLQRMWLTAASEKLLIQPIYTPIAFYQCNEANQKPTNDKKLWGKAEAVIEDLTDFLNINDLSKLFFMGRIGKGEVPKSRAVRLPLEKLIVKGDQ